MHPNPAFRKTGTDKNLAFARERGFGILSVNGEAGPLMAHVPFTLNKDGSIAALHLVRSNPILNALETPQRAVIAVNGPDGYVSPDWYGVEDQVPTWNYVAVHLRGTLERRPDDVLPGLLEFQSYAFESRIKGKTPWRPEKMTPEVFEKMQRAIVPVRLMVETVEGTWKLGQNKPETVRHAASRKLKKGVGQELAALAALMRRRDFD
jgi:transcriptional regulator